MHTTSHSTSSRLRHPLRCACVAALLVLTGATTTAAQEAGSSADSPADAEAAVRQVVLDAYVSGIHRDRDETAVRQGFHPQFVMLINQEGRLVKLSLDEWLDRLELGVPASDSIHPVFRHVEVTGHAATVGIEIHRNEQHVFTDYIGLYRFPEGWRIVSKTFYAH